MMTHRGFSKQFEIRGCRFEAVGLLDESEPAISGDEMMKRAADDNGGAIDNGEMEFIWKYRDLLPPELQNYCLVTKQCDYPDFPRHIMCFDYAEGIWWKFYEKLDTMWNGRNLVLRRLP